MNSKFPPIAYMLPCLLCIGIAGARIFTGHAGWEIFLLVAGALSTPLLGWRSENRDE